MPRPPTAEQLREDALAIWHAGVSAVDSEQLVRGIVNVTGNQLRFGEEAMPLDDLRHICVVGAGKAGAGMASGLEQALGPSLLTEKRVSGWVNVPADCVRPLRTIHLHAARPPGVNEPTEAGAAGCREILQRVRALGEEDLCICLLSGGGSALLPAPAQGVSLAEKLAITRHLSAAGANIQQLNTVRKQLSQIKGGGLARACRAGRLITLIISDVLGDPLDIIASGPTVANTTTAQDALGVLDRFPVADQKLSTHLRNYLSQRAANSDREREHAFNHVTNIVIGNNSVAVDAAGVEAERRGYSHAMVAARTLEGEADDVGRHLARMARQMRDADGPDCLITGGEPAVTLADAAERGKGGRNQQLVLAALHELTDVLEQPEDRPPLAGIVILAGGTDGEDGPTDAAGAWVDEQVDRLHQQLGFHKLDFLRRNDAYNFFQPLGALIKTGPTHTNVCDLRVVVVSRAR